MSNQRLLTLHILMVTLIGLVSLSPAPRQPLVRLHPDAGLNVTQLITKHGYPVESHQVQTEDGYILTLHRIPHGQQDDGNKNKEPVLLVHGLQGCSANWIELGPDKSLGYLLADAGYDVWLGNVRGNTWSRQHVTLDPDQDAAEFFAFSFHEIGFYDLPAKIDHILKTSGQEQLFYVGHSQGTSAFFAMAAARPEYNAKIKLMQALAPIVFLGDIPDTDLQNLVQYLDEITAIVKTLNINEVLAYSEIFEQLAVLYCTEDSEYQDICAALINSIVGSGDSRLDPDLIPVILGNNPAGASAHNFIHYGQLIRSKKFAWFDYGANNTIVYGQDTPPEYDLEKITAPISLNYGGQDGLGDSIDVLHLYRQLSSVITLREISYFGHLDFIWATSIVEDLNKALIAEIVSI